MKNDLKNITRMDQAPRKKGNAGQHGWWVRLQKNRVKFQHFFNDNDYGGKDSGLIAARIFRDAIKIEHIEREGGTPLRHLHSPTRRNTSGHIGVSKSFRYKKIKNEKIKLYYWQAQYPSGKEDGKYITKVFTIEEYGEQEAFRMALEARAIGIKKIEKESRVSYYAPKDVQQKIWRYLDFTKFVSLLDTESLFFPCANLFEDKFEGSYSKLTKEFRSIINKNTITPNNNMELLRKEVGISCWHANDYESAAMWELYSNSSESVCIQSSFKKLSDILADQADIGLVQYIDYQKEFIPEYDPYLSFFYKRKSFEHENEVRALVKQVPTENLGYGINIPVDLDVLIEKIFISPRAPIWFHELVENTVKKFGLEKSIVQSSLSEDPIY